MAKISVIVPIYGVEKYLRQAIDSIINQTCNDLEIILIDDGSKDNCPNIIDEYAKKDNRIVAVHKENGGYGAACNTGLSRATSEYIAILEPDDYIAPEMYQDLYNIAKQFDSDIVKSSFYDNLYNKWNSRIKKVVWKDYIPEDKSFTIKEYPYFLNYHPSIWSCIYKKEFLNKKNIRFLEEPGSGWTDNPFQVQTMCLANRINYSSKAYYYWRRLNFFESDDLKDYSIPFKRTDEIHKWLEENNIKDENILTQLFRRELAYVGIVLGMKHISDEKDCYKRISLLLSRCPASFCEDKRISEFEKTKYLNIKKNPNRIRTKFMIKRILKDILSIRWSHREKIVVLFGHMYIFSSNKKGEDNIV